MTVGEAGKREGLLREVVREVDLDTDTPTVDLSERKGEINSDLTIGVDVTAAVALKAGEGVCSPGMKLHGAGFIVTPQEAAHLGLGRRPGLERHIREYRNGRDLTARTRGMMVIDLFGLDIEDVRLRFPEVYQYVKMQVKEKVEVNDKGEKQFVGRDWNHRETYRDNWWIFGEPRADLRPALVGLDRYLVTPVTQKQGQSDPKGRRAKDVKHPH